MTTRELIINTALSIILKEQKVTAKQLVESLNNLLPGSTFTASDITRAQTLDFWSEPITPITRPQKVGTRFKAPLLYQGLMKYLDVQEYQRPDGVKCLKHNSNGREWPLLVVAKPAPFVINSGSTTLPEDAMMTSSVTPSFMPEFDFEYVLRLIRNCSGEIEILQSYLSRIDDFYDILKENLTTFPDSKISILLLDPNHEAAHLRFKGIKPVRPHEDVLEKLAKNLKSLRELESRFPNRMKVGTYNAIPAVVYYRAGDMIFAGHHFMGKYSYESSFICLPYQLDHPFVKDLKEHWDKLWEYSNRYEDETRFTMHFKCHCFHENSLKFINLAIDPATNDAKLYNTPSKRVYVGSISSLRTGFCQMHLPDIEITDDGRTRGVASFILNLNIMDIENTELATGIFTVNSPVEKDTIYARSVIVERLNSTFSERQKKKLLQQFFDNPKEVELANRLGMVNTWHALELKLKKK